MADGIDTIYVTDSFLPKDGNGNSIYPSAAVTYLSFNSSHEQEYYRSALGIKFSVDKLLSPGQAMKLASIIDYGYSNGYGASEIVNVANQAFYESSLGSLEGPNGSHVGMFQYAAGPWADLGHSNLDINNDKDQIKAMFQDETNFEARYSAGIESGSVPKSVSFADFLEIKHHAGQNDTNYLGATEQSYVAGYEAKASLLGLDTFGGASNFHPNALHGLV